MNGGSHYCPEFLVMFTLNRLHFMKQQEWVETESYTQALCRDGVHHWCRWFTLGDEWVTLTLLCPQRSKKVMFSHMTSVILLHRSGGLYQHALGQTRIRQTRLCRDPSVRHQLQDGTLHYWNSYCIWFLSPMMLSWNWRWHFYLQIAGVKCQYASTGLKSLVSMNKPFLCTYVLSQFSP